MSDPSAPDEQPPVYSPVLRPGPPAPADPAAPVPPTAEAPAAPPGAPVPEAAVPSADEPEPKGGSTWRSWAVAGAACGLVVVAGIFLTRDKGDDSTDGSLQAGVVAPDGRNGPGGTFAGLGAQGEITGIDGSTITLAATQPGSSDTTEVTVETDGDTRFADIVDGTVGDLEVGDNVLVRGEDGDDADDGSLTAASITDNGDQDLAGGALGGPGTFRTGDGGPNGTMVFPEGADPPDGATPPDGERRVLARLTVGEITKVDGDQITVKTVEGDDVVVTATSDTDVHVTREIDLGDLAKGDEVRVTGERDGDTIRATSVRRGDDGGFVIQGGPRRSQSGTSGSAS